MFIPLYDHVALKYLRHANVTLALIAANIALHLLGLTGLLGSVEHVDLALGLIPAVLDGKAVISADIATVPAWLTPLSSIFLHGSIWHLAGNMLFLWVFGDNVEDAMGSGRFLAFYLLCGIVSGLTFAIAFPASQSPLIGASGAISAIAAAYFILYPKARVFGLLFNWVPISIPAWIVLGVWAIWQFASALLLSDSHTGWWAHVGGIVSGALLLPIFKRREVPLFGERIT